jgi:hypothetical protein
MVMKTIVQNTATKCGKKQNKEVTPNPRLEAIAT